MPKLHLNFFIGIFIKNARKYLKIFFHEFTSFVKISNVILIKKIEIQRQNISHFKGFSLMNLQYEIRVCQKMHNEVTMTLYFYYEIACIRLYTSFSVLMANLFQNFITSSSKQKIIHARFEI